MSRTYVDISQWWLKDDKGKEATVNSVCESLKNTENELTRHTLTRAKDGKLEKAELANLRKLTNICSTWSGKKITLNDIVFFEN